MALNLQNKYPGRFDPVSADYPQGKFKNRSSPTAQDGSYMERDWLNDWAGFFGAILNNAGVVPNGNIDTAQSSQIYNALLMSIYPVGAPIPWGTATPPGGFMLLTGQAFNVMTYPLLAKCYPSGVLPDMRAGFIRGWDNGRGVDAGRSVLSEQSDQMISHSHDFTHAKGANPGGALSSASAYAAQFFPTAADLWQRPPGTGWTGGATGLTTTVSVGGAENRPRNIAFNYIVRAA